MLFNSIEFIFFFAVVTAVYYILPHKLRWLCLLLASCYFYMAFVPVYILILFGTILIDYIAGIQIHKAAVKTKKAILIVSIISNVGVLFVFKYYNFFIENINELSEFNLPLLSILLPIGLSFHTFQAMSYTIEVYRGRQEPERHFGLYALYVMFYPQLVAGPIERPQNVLHQFREEKKFDYQNIADGLKLMAWGMFKKVVVADKIALYVNSVYNNNTQYEGLTVIIACILFSFQIYLDFSGYSDLALGSAKVMGFDLMTNFNRPYLAKSIVEFWSRWHISLSTWFRDYLYIPLGGNKKGKSRTYFNQFVVFLVSGFWHGANWTFIVWGFIHAVYVISYHLFSRFFGKLGSSDFLNRIFVFILVTFAWIFFRAESLKQAFAIISSSFKNIPAQIKGIVVNSNYERLKILYADNKPGIFLVAVAGLLFVLLIEWKQKEKTIPQYFNSLPKLGRVCLYYGLIYACIFFAAGQQSQFIYFQF